MKNKNKAFLTRLIHVKIKNNSSNKIIITAVTKDISSNRSALSQRQFNADTYHNSTSIAPESDPRS